MEMVNTHTHKRKEGEPVSERAVGGGWKGGEAGGGVREAGGGDAAVGWL